VRTTNSSEGRIALPLAARGVRVDGIELSPDMVDRLRAKSRGDDIDVTMGDIARTTKHVSVYELGPSREG
jgi:hypothetical protein